MHTSIGNCKGLQCKLLGQLKRWICHNPICIAMDMGSCEVHNRAITVGIYV